jgi:hypothetical protein
MMSFEWWSGENRGVSANWFPGGGGDGGVVCGRAQLVRKEWRGKEELLVKKELLEREGKGTS